jgi:hypothetical protein
VCGSGTAVIGVDDGIVAEGPYDSRQVTAAVSLFAADR